MFHAELLAIAEVSKGNNIPIRKLKRTDEPFDDKYRIGHMRKGPHVKRNSLDSSLDNLLNNKIYWSGEEGCMTKFNCSVCGAVWQRQGKTNCWSSDPAQAPAKPDYCPSREHMPLINKAFARYRGTSEDAKISRVATQVEGMCYQRTQGSQTINARWTRVEDTIAFAKLMKYRWIGLATCIGLLDETNRLALILRAQGFEPLSVCCKAGSKDKLELGIKEADKVRPGTFEPACNPIAQARLLNKAKTDMNIIIGLCVGHDMLFSKHSAAPVTTLVVKDRVTGHNPVSVLYGQNFYYKRLQGAALEVPSPGPGDALEKAPRKQPIKARRQRRRS